MLTRGALQKSDELAGGGVQYDILEILNFVGVYTLVIVEQTFKIILIKNNCR
jgi:hypothetical protein